jgi:predicted ATP-grasp superfamily ATP-dependent carboligase
VIFAFAKSADDNLASLAKAIDKAVADNADQKVAAVINFTGESTDEYLDKIAEFAEKHGIKNTALVVTGDAGRFKVSEEAEVTVMNYKNRKVTFNFSTLKDGLGDQAVKAVVEGVKSLLN